VPGGFVYYAGSKARVEVPFDESLRTQTRAAIALARDLATREAPPEPLPPGLRHRCFGCSLAPVCNPEETLYLIHQAPREMAALLARVPGAPDPGSLLGLEGQSAAVYFANPILAARLR
jgi:CRISP-associated protein Cas1